jgi:thioester reductase-like protein
MSQDSVLPDDIRPAIALTPRDPPGRVLVTGATGFLGAHLVHTLMTETAVDVCCLVRAGDGESASRVHRNLQRYGLWSASFANRIDVVNADLAVPRLGLSSCEYARLAEDVDAIYHAGADVDWVRPYRALRDVNVIGTRELLRLACEARPAAFHFVSSLSVCTRPAVPRPWVNRMTCSRSSIASRSGTPRPNALPNRSDASGWSRWRDIS